MSVYCTLFSQTFYGLLFCYLTITDVHATLYLQIIDFRFPSCCTSQLPKKLNQIITVNSSTNTHRSYHQKNNSCTLCVPMFIRSRASDISRGRGAANSESAKSREIHKNTRNLAKFARNLTKYMSPQHIWKLSWLLGLLTCCKLANLPWNLVTAASEQHPKTTRRS